MDGNREVILEESTLRVLRLIGVVAMEGSVLAVGLILVV
jgi:hypothetical protein